MKKRLISAVLTAAMVAVPFAACAEAEKEETEAEKEETVVLEMYEMKGYLKDVYLEIVDEFCKEHPNVKVEYTSPDDSETVFFTRVSSNDIPDIMSIYPAEYTYQACMRDGVYADLTGKEFLNNVEERALEFSKCNADGKSYAVPMIYNTMGIYCNKTLFEEAGLELPTTWDELISCLETFKTNGYESPLFFCTSDGFDQFAERLIGIINPNFCDVSEAVGNGEGSFTDADKPEVKQVAEAILQLAEYGPVDIMGADSEQGLTDFAMGNYPMAIGGTWKNNRIVATNPDLDVTMIPIPNPVSDEQRVPINVDVAWAYSATTEHPEECEALLEYMSRPENVQKIADVEGAATCVKGVDDTKSILKDINEACRGENTFLTLVNFWPSGWRSEWKIYLQQLLDDGNIDALLAETDRISVDCYNK